MKLRRNQKISPKNFPFPRQQIKNIYGGIWAISRQEMKRAHFETVDFYNSLIFIIHQPCLVQSFTRASVQQFAKKGQPLNEGYPISLVTELFGILPVKVSALSPSHNHLRKVRMRIIGTPMLKLSLPLRAAKLTATKSPFSSITGDPLDPCTAGMLQTMRSPSGFCVKAPDVN